jgi:hypothetical protein
MPLLEAFKSQQQALELVFPRKGPLDPQAERMDGGVEAPLAPALGALAVTRILKDVGEQARVENAPAVPCGIKTAGRVPDRC